MKILKNKKIIDHAYKVVLSLMILFIVYNLMSILFISRMKEKRFGARISSITQTIENNLKRSRPPELKEEEYGKKVALIEPKLITKISIFAGPENLREVDKAEKDLLYVQVDIPHATEIALKGITDKLALINVRRKINEVWYEHSFPLRSKEQIGAEKIIQNKRFDFTTNCILDEIINGVKRPITMQKKEVLFSDAGKFIGIKMVAGDTFMKSTSKVTYKDEGGVIKDLWLGESHIIKEEPKKEPAFSEDPVGNVKSKIGDTASKIKKKLTKDDKPEENKTE